MQAARDMMFMYRKNSFEVGMKQKLTVEPNQLNKIVSRWGFEKSFWLFCEQLSICLDEA